MSLDEYFTKNGHGTGVLSTADGNGRPNMAVFGRPHVIDEKTVAFVMARRQSYQNLQSNPCACYLYFEGGGEPAGTRLSLTKIREESDMAEIDVFRRQRSQETYERYKGMAATLVYFRIDGVRPLVGAGAAGEENIV